MDGGFDLIMMTSTDSPDSSNTGGDGPTLWEVFTFVSWLGVGIVLFLIDMLTFTIYWVDRSAWAIIPFLGAITGTILVISIMKWLIGGNHA